MRWYHIWQGIFYFIPDVLDAAKLSAALSESPVLVWDVWDLYQAQSSITQKPADKTVVKAAFTHRKRVSRRTVECSRRQKSGLLSLA